MNGLPVVPIVQANEYILTVEEDPDGDYHVQAITEDDEETGPGIDALENKFLLGVVEEDEAGGPEFEDETELVAVYWGVQVHTCKSNPDSAEGCERFTPHRGEVEASDIPDAVRTATADLFADEVYVPTPDAMRESDDPDEDRELPGVSLLSDATDEQIARLEQDDTPDTRGFY
jgi:hypothetical protein